MSEGKREFPKKKDNPRNFKLMIAVTEQEKEALAREADATGKSQSEIAYQMLRRGSLVSLVSRYFPNAS